MEPFIDPATGGLSFVEVTNAAEKQAKKIADINDQFNPKPSKF